MKTIRIASALVCAIVVASVQANDAFNPILKAEVTDDVAAPAIPKVIKNDVKQKRNYPMQPPVIPHNTRGYEVNTRVNKCMSCHSRDRVEESQAPMVSVTHFMDRDGNFLAEISPRRYFCNQCHVTQSDVEPVIENTFTDSKHLMKLSNQ
ncbi:nitrate reductase cytochrome c-type subunit [Catenovulum agarivorans]